MRGRRRTARLLALWFLLAGTLFLAGPHASRAGEPVSVVDWLKGKHRDASFEARRRLFEHAFPGEDYRGTGAQNLRLLERLRKEAGEMHDLEGDPSLLVVRRSEGERTCEVDLRSQVLELELREDVREEMRWGSGSTEPAPPERLEEPPVLPALPAPGGTAPFVSAALLAQKAKVFDDGLYAAVELAAEDGLAAADGTGDLPGKRELLRRLRARLTDTDARGEGAAILLAAADEGGGPGPTPAGLAPDVRRLEEAFEADPIRSRPLGFYTWSEDLRRVFRQDRVLQTPLTEDAARPLVRAFEADPVARASYERALGLYEGLTNDFASGDLRTLLAGTPERPGGQIAILPASRAFETDLVKRLWGDRPVPVGASALDRLVDEIRSGRLSLEPTARSGWYDRQAWALAPLLLPEKTPEGKRLRVGPRYRAYLVELFRGLLALTRETHVKQAEIPFAGACMPPFSVSPVLTVEPLATHYARWADAYAFVGKVLAASFGAARLATLHRLTPEGPVAVPLDQELRAMEELFRGAAETAFLELGSAEASSTPEAAKARAAFAAWRRALGDDPDLSRDARMMVPVFYDVGREKLKAWVFLGWTRQWLDVRFVEKPGLAFPGQEPPRVVVFVPSAYRVLSPVVAEVYVSDVLDRDAFRALCDRWKTRSAILEHLH